MPAENKTIKFDVSPNDSGALFGDPNAVSATVPEGEIWYVEGIVVDSEDPNGDVTPSRARIGISTADNYNTNSGIHQVSRGVNKTSGLKPGAKATLGAYAYPGETVAGGIDNPDKACKGALLIRRVL